MQTWESFPPATGTTLEGRFVVERVLGSGAMGVVLLARDLELRKNVSIKLLRPEFVESELVVERFLCEPRAVARMKSEHVVDVLDAGTLSTGIPYFVTEHLSGIDLGRLVEERGPLPVDDVVEYALQTLEALVEAHRHGLVHRDLKPTNLFLATREGDSALVKVLDFGVSMLVGWDVTANGSVTRQGTVLGSPRYMAPEQIQEARTVDARGDIWSLGAVMHELLTGRAPFDGPSIPDVIRAVCTTPYEPPKRKDLPPALAEILRCSMRKKAHDRYRSAVQLARAFQPLARTAAARISIDRILLKAASAMPPRLDDERARLPSITPVTTHATLSSVPWRGLWRVAPAGLVVAVAVGASLFLWRAPSGKPRPPARVAAVVPPVPSRVGPKVPEPRRSVGVPAVEPSAAVAPSAPQASSARQVLTVRTPRRPTTPSPPVTASATSRPVAEQPPFPYGVRRVRQLDTVNPFVKK